MRHRLGHPPNCEAIDHDDPVDTQRLGTHWATFNTCGAVALDSRGAAHLCAAHGALVDAGAAVEAYVHRTRQIIIR